MQGYGGLRKCRGQCDSESVGGYRGPGSGLTLNLKATGGVDTLTGEE